MSCSKSGRTTLGVIVLAGLKDGGTTKLRVPIITGCNCVARLQRIAPKIQPQFLTEVILRMHNF
jgi:hypothetical protein